MTNVPMQLIRRSCVACGQDAVRSPFDNPETDTHTFVHADGSLLCGSQFLCEHWVKMFDSENALVDVKE